MAHDGMHRTQISLEKWQYQYVVERAQQAKTSISDVIRHLIAQAAGAEAATERTGDPLFTIIGMAEGDGEPVGRNHDRYLYTKE